MNGNSFDKDFDKLYSYTHIYIYAMNELYTLFSCSYWDVAIILVFPLLSVNSGHSPVETESLKSKPRKKPHIQSKRANYEQYSRLLAINENNNIIA